MTELNKVKEELQKTGLIRESVRRLQTIIEKIEDGITLSDVKGNFELFNSKMQEITGYTMEEANRCGDFTTLLYPDFQERKKALDNINETIKKGVSRNIETTIQIKDGTKKILLVSTSIINLDNRNMFLSVYHDITERKRMEEQIQRNFNTQNVVSDLLSLSLINIPLEKLLERAMERILSISWLSFESRGSIFLVDDVSGMLIMKVQNNLAEPIQKKCAQISSGQCLCGRALLTRETQFATHIDTRHEITYDGIGPHGHYCVPIIHLDKVLGVLNIYVTEGHQRKDNEVEFLMVISNVLAGIIQRNKTEKMLHESTTMYETLINASPEAISVFDMDGHFIYVSPQTLKLHGYERKEDLLGHSAFELIAPEDHTSAMNILQQITKTPILQDLQYTAVRKDGTRFILEGSAVVIKDQHGNPKSFISVTRDITERKKMEEAIKESEEKFRIMSTAAFDAVITMDSQGYISFWNESAKRIFGYSTEEISGKNLHMVLAPNRYHDAHKKGFIHFQKTGEGPALNKMIELVGVRKDGTEFPLELSVAPVQVRGQWHAVGIIRDIIGRKKIEDDLKKKIDELERYKKVTIGRELQMIELKKQIQELEEKLNNTK